MGDKTAGWYNKLEIKAVEFMGGAGLSAKSDDYCSCSYSFLPPIMDVNSAVPYAFVG